MSNNVAPLVGEAAAKADALVRDQQVKALTVARLYVMESEQRLDAAEKRLQELIVSIQQGTFNPFETGGIYNAVR